MWVFKDKSKVKNRHSTELGKIRGTINCYLRRHGNRQHGKGVFLFFLCLVVVCGDDPECDIRTGSEAGSSEAALIIWNI